MKPTIFLSFITVIITGLVYPFISPDADQAITNSVNKVQPAVKLYVLDGGTIENIDVTGFGLKREESSATRLPVPIFLIVHPKGTLIWDAGAVPDTSWNYNGASSIKHRLILPDRQRDITLTKPLKMQLSDIGYSADKITWLALSHYHYDHTANANEFANATWLVRQNEYDAMFAEPIAGVRPSTYSALRNSKKQILTNDEYDLFGDGTVIIKSAPGHTPGHLVLFVKLAKAGNVLLSGDLYHLSEEKTLDRVPTFEFNAEQTRATRIFIDSFLKKTNAQLWIQHDPKENAMLKKSPDFYE